MHVYLSRKSTPEGIYAPPLAAFLPAFAAAVADGVADAAVCLNAGQFLWPLVEWEWETYPGDDGTSVEGIDGSLGEGSSLFAH